MPKPVQISARHLFLAAAVLLVLGLLFWVALLSTPVFNCIQTGNIEWVPLLGAFISASLGLVFLSMKPQATLAIIAFIAVGVYQKEGIRKLVQAVLPTLGLFLLSWALFGAWFLKIGGAFEAAGDFVMSV